MSNRVIKNNYRSILGRSRKRRMAAVISVFSAIIVLTSWFGFNQIQQRFEMQTADSLNTYLSAIHETVHHVWIDDLFLDLAILAKEPLLVQYTQKLIDKSNQLNSSITSNIKKDIYASMKDVMNRHKAKGFFIIAPNFISLSSMRDENIGTKNIIAKYYPDSKRFFPVDLNIFLPLSLRFLFLMGTA